MVKGETGESKEKSEKTIGRNFKNRVELSFSFFFFFLLFFWLVWTGISLYPVYTVISVECQQTLPERDICFSAVNKRERLDKRNVALIAIQSCAETYLSFCRLPTVSRLSP